MKKAIPFIFALILLTACQQNPVPRESADKTPEEKASISSQLSLEVKPPAGSESPASPNSTSPSTSSASVTVPSQATVVPNTVGMAITDQGILPPNIDTKVGYKLMVYNSLDKQVELYTSGPTGKPCPFLGATIEIPGGQTKTFQFDKPFQCTLINQLNTDQKSTLQVEGQDKTLTK